MPYFLILPAYITLLVALVGIAVIARFVPRLRPASGYFIGGAIGTLIGFLIINAIVILVGIAPVWLAQKFTFPNWLQPVIKVFVVATLFVGPFVGSAIGILLGFAYGIYLVFKRRRHAA